MAVYFLEVTGVLLVACKVIIRSHNCIEFIRLLNILYQTQIIKTKSSPFY